MNDELLEGFVEWSAGLPASNVKLIVYPDGSAEIWRDAPTTNGVIESEVIQTFEDIQTAADWFTDQGYGVQE